MQQNKNDENQEEKPDNSRPTSRRNSAGSRKTSLKNEPIRGKHSALSSAPASAQSTPKKYSQKAQNLDFVVTGKQILKKEVRANSLPGVYRRSPDTARSRGNRCSGYHRNTSISQTCKRDSSLEDDMSLDLSQVTDFEDTSFKKRIYALATSTPKSQNQLQQRNESVQSRNTYRISERSVDSFDGSSFSTSSTSTYRPSPSTDPNGSVVSPLQSQSSVEMSPRSQISDVAVASPMSIRSQVSGSSNIASWMDSEIDRTKVQEKPEGEWNNFWANYSHALSRAGVKNYYDQCPTPYRTENIDMADLDLSSESSRLRSPQHVDKITSIIRHDGLRLTARETQSLVKCAHILGSVLSKAIDRNSRQEQTLKLEDPTPNPDIEIKKKNFKLELSPETLPIPVHTIEPEIPLEEIQKSTMMTQTDISLPFTKSAPRIFEKILRQLSRSSIDEVEKKPDAEEGKEKDLANKTI